ncbi:hypothetical protein BLA29_015192, partial [Euroglyphus maynei]
RFRKLIPIGFGYIDCRSTRCRGWWPWCWCIDQRWWSDWYRFCWRFRKFIPIWFGYIGCRSTWSRSWWPWCWYIDQRWWWSWYWFRKLIPI